MKARIKSPPNIYDLGKFGGLSSSQSQDCQIIVKAIAGFLSQNI